MMNNQSLTYFERLENLYVLLETRQMLQMKLAEKNNEVDYSEVIQEDLRKIEEEIIHYTAGKSIEEFDLSLTSSLFNPAMYIDEESKNIYKD